MSSQVSSPNKLWLLLVIIGCVAAGFLGRGLWDASTALKDANQGAARKPHFDFIVGGPDPFWNLVLAGAQAAAKEYDVDLTVHVPSGSPDDQTIKLTQVEARGTSGVAISPIAPNEQSLLLSRLATKSILVTFDNDAPQSLRHCYVGTNNYAAGKMCAKVVEEALPEGGKIVVFIGDVERANARERLHGFHDHMVDDHSPSENFDYPLDKPYGRANWTVVKTFLDGQDPNQAEVNVKTALDEHPDIDCVVGLYGYNGPACLKVLKETNKLADVKIVAFDEHEVTLDGVANGDIYATIVQGSYDYGFESVRLLKSLFNSDKNMIPFGGAGFFFLPCSVVSKDNVADHRAKLAERLADNKEPADSGKAVPKAGG